MTEDIESFSINCDEQQISLQNERPKNIYKHEKFALSRLLSSLDYPYALGYKEVLLPILSASYTAYQSLFTL